MNDIQRSVYSQAAWEWIHNRNLHFCIHCLWFTSWVHSPCCETEETRSDHFVESWKLSIYRPSERLKKLHRSRSRSFFFFFFFWFIQIEIGTQSFGIDKTEWEQVSSISKEKKHLWLDRNFSSCLKMSRTRDLQAKISSYENQTGFCFMTRWLSWSDVDVTLVAFMGSNRMIKDGVNLGLVSGNLNSRSIILLYWPNRRKFC